MVWKRIWTWNVASIIKDRSQAILCWPNPSSGCHREAERRDWEDQNAIDTYVEMQQFLSAPNLPSDIHKWLELSSTKAIASASHPTVGIKRRTLCRSFPLSWQAIELQADIQGDDMQVLRDKEANMEINYHLVWACQSHITMSHSLNCPGTNLVEKTKVTVCLGNSELDIFIDLLTTVQKWA